MVLVFQTYVFIYNIYIHTFIYFVHANVSESAPSIVGRSEYNLQESVLLVYHVGSMYPTQIHRLL